MIFVESSKNLLATQKNGQHMHTRFSFGLGWKFAAAFAGSALLVAALYAHILHAPFVFDDALLLGNPLLQMQSLSLAGSQDSREIAKMRYLLFAPDIERKTGDVTFAFNFYSGGVDSFGFHMVNIAIHAINGLLLLYFAYLLTRARRAEYPFFACFLGMLLWLAHPAQIQAVTYVTQRYTSLCSLFFLATLICYIRGRSVSGPQRHIFLAGSALSFLLALGCKQIAAMLPFYLLLLEPLLWPESDDKTGRRRRIGLSILAFGAIAAVYLPSHLWKTLTTLYEDNDLGMAARILVEARIAVYFAGLFLYLALMARPPRQISTKTARIVIACSLFMIGGALVAIGAVFLPETLKTWGLSYFWRDITPGQRLLTEMRVVGYYVSLLLYPHPVRLRVDYDFPLSLSLFAPVTTLLCLIAIVSLLGFSACYFRKKPLTVFAILWFLGNLVIESTVVPLDLAYEHRLYLPSMIPIVLATCAIGNLAQKSASRKNFYRAATAVCYTVALVLLCLATHHRNSVWQDEVALWEDNALKSPRKARVWASLGNACLERALKSQEDFSEDYARAEEYTKRAILLAKQSNTPDHYPLKAIAYNTLGLIYLKTMRCRQAESSLKKAIHSNGRFAKPYVNLAALYIHQNRLQDALTNLEKAGTLDPYAPNFFYNLALVHYKTGDYPNALRTIEMGRQVCPFHEGIAKFLETARATMENLVQAQKLNERGARYFEKGLQDRDPQRQIQCYLRAEENWNEAVAIFPEFLDPYTNLALLYYRMRDYSKSIAVLRRKIGIAGTEKIRDDFMLYYLLGLSHLAKREYPLAILSLKTAKALKSDDAMLHGALGLGYWGMGRREKAEKILREAVAMGFQCRFDIDPDIVAAHYYLASLYIEQNRPEYALAIADSILKQNPDDANALWYAGEACLHQMQPQRAVAIFEKLLSLAHPERGKIQANLGTAYFHLAKMAQRSEERADLCRKAENCLKKAAEEDLVVAYYNLGELYRYQDNYPVALETFLRAVEIYPADLRLRYLLGVVYWETGDRTRALPCFEAAIDYAPARATLGLAYFAAGDRTRANEFLSRAVALGVDPKTLPRIVPDLAPAYNFLACAYMEQRQFDSASTILRQIIDRRRDYAEAQWNLGVIYLQQDKPQQAAEVFSEFLQLKPDDPQALYNLACAHLNQGHYSLAIEVLQRATAVHPQNPSLICLLGAACLHQGDLPRARSFFEKTLALDPKDKAARNYLERMGPGK